MARELLSGAIELRKKDDFEESRRVLFALIDSESSNGAAYLNIAGSYDNQGLESEAPEYYKKSLNEELSDKDRFEAKFGLAVPLALGGWDFLAQRNLGLLSYARHIR